MLNSYSPLETKLTDAFGIIAPLQISGEASNEIVPIDENLQLIRVFPNPDIQVAIEQSSNFGSTRPHKIQYKFEARRVEKTAFEASEAFDNFCVAIRILTGMRCETKVFLPVDGTTVYKPFVFDFRDFINDHRFTSKIDTKRDIEKVSQIYKRIRELELGRHHDNVGPRIKNAIRIFQASYHEHWYLLNITLLLVVLESLFTDSSKSEVSYKIALRTAFLLYPESPIDRKRVFNLIKVAYDIRSSFVHGTHSDEKKAATKLAAVGLTDVSISYALPQIICETVSQTLKTIILDDKLYQFFSSKQKENVEATFFEDLVLSS